MTTQQSKCDRKQLCGYLKKIFIEGGEDKVNNYNDYLSKELNKKRNSVERSLELQDQKTVVTWWKEHVMKHCNREALKAAKVKKDNDRINNIASYFAKKIIAGEMSLEDIKSEAMRDITNDILNDTPFYVDSKEQTVIADRVIEPVVEERIIDKREPEEVKVGGTVRDGYLGGSAWTGCNYHGYMRYSEINKIVKKAFQKKYPGVKVSCTGSSFSGGQDCRGVIILPVEKCTKTFEEFRADLDKYYQEKGYCFQVGHYLNSWAIDECNGDYEKMLHKVYDNYINRAADGYQGISINNLDELDKMILKPNAYEMSLYLNALYDSFNDYDINGMVDYFDTLFYKQTYLRTINGVAA